jgi:hypothetical protein
MKKNKKQKLNFIIKIILVIMKKIKMIKLLLIIIMIMKKIKILKKKEKNLLI